jgi:serine protease Do
MVANKATSQLTVVALVVKLVAMAAGFVGTFIGLMAIVGAFSASGWARSIVALVVSIGVPLLVADRLLPDDSTKPAAGVVTDVLATSWFGFTFLFAGLLHAVTAPMLLREGDRLMESGWQRMASAAYFLASARVEPTPGVADPAPSASGSASAGAPVAPSASGSAPAAADAGPPRDAGPEKATPPRGEKTPAELFKELAPSVVTIFVKGQGEGSGTGFLIDGEGTIATNHHVIAGAANVRIKFMSGAVFDSVELLADATAVDLALLRVDLKNPSDGGPNAAVTVQPLTLGDSDAVVVGERAISIGNPLGLEHTLTDGLISSRRVYEGRAWIQMSVPVSPGNSGGPLFNMRGEVVGITTQQVLGGSGGFGRAQNLNLAVPVNELKKLIEPTYPSRRKFGDGTGPSQW